MIEEIKYCSDVIKRINKELVMTKKDNEDLKDYTTCCICDNDYVGNDVKVRDHYHITGKYRDSAHRDFNINLKLDHKAPIVFHNLQNYGLHLIMQELGKLNLHINVISNELKKYMSFTIINLLSIIF